MALTQASLSTRIQTEVVNLYGAADDAAKLKDFADALALAIVNEITSSAVVTVTGVQAGGSNATGTIA